MKRRRQKRTVGDVVEIELGDGSRAYARVLGEATFAFYDCRAKETPPLEQIVRSPVLFQVAVMDHAVKNGRWTVVGHAALEPPLLEPLPQFIQDPLRPEDFSIYHHGVIRPATREECIGLECAAVWDPTHVEDRLRDHYAGRPNQWVESLKME